MMFFAMSPFSEYISISVGKINLCLLKYGLKNLMDMSEKSVCGNISLSSPDD